MCSNDLKKKVRLQDELCARMMMMMMIIMQLVRRTPDERALKVHNAGLENRFKLRSVTFTVLL